VREFLRNLQTACERAVLEVGEPCPNWPGPPHFQGFTITHRHTTLSRNTLDEWSARRRDIYLTTQHSQETDIAGFEPTIPATERHQTHALDRAPAGICGNISYTISYFSFNIRASRFSYCRVSWGFKTVHRCCGIHVVPTCYSLTSQQVGFNCHTSSWPSDSKVKC
jgi:hypothetical protein